MGTETSKGAKTELPIFLHFMQTGKITIDPYSVQKRNPPEPDILCKTTAGELVAFELVEICDSNIARLKEDGVYIRTTDPSYDILENKLNKRYVTDAPIELLCYVNGRAVSPDNYIAERVAPLFLKRKFQYRRVWLFSSYGVKILWECS